MPEPHRQTRVLKPRRQGEAPTEEQYDMPWQLRHRFPIQDLFRGSAAGGNEKEQQRHSHCDRAVIQKRAARKQPRPPRDYRIADPDLVPEEPEERQQHEVRQNDRFLVRERPQRSVLIPQNTLIESLRLPAAGVQMTQQQPRQNKEEHGNRKCEEEPARERNLRRTREVNVQNPGEREIRRRTHQRCHTTDGCAVRHTEKQAGCKSPLLRSLLQLQHHRQDDRHHHHRGCRIGDPHRQKSRGHHESQENPPRTNAAPQEHAQCDPPMQIPALHGQRNHKAADEQQNDVVEIDWRDLPAIHNPEQREQHDREQRGGRQRNRFRHPPYRHQQGDGRRPCHGRPAGIQIEEHEKPDCQNRSRDQTDILHPRAGMSMQIHSRAPNGRCFANGTIYARAATGKAQNAH